MNKDGTGVIHKIIPRKNHISRKAPRIKGASTRGERLEQIIAANVDNIVIVASIKQPKFNNRIIDRFIVAGESSHINPIIVVNKIDLDNEEEHHEWTTLYKKLGYNVVNTSVIDGRGIEELITLLKSKVSLFWGQSGVGKSSLLNTMYTGLDLRVEKISTSTSKGKHTTVTAFMLPVEENTFVIDTPGIREIDPYGIKKEDLGHYFKEFEEFIIECKFNTCTHNHEPSCAVLEAFNKGLIDGSRYQSYLNILDTIEDDLFF